MSAYDDFCGCGEYSCPRCFNGDAPGPEGNAWLDELWDDARLPCLVCGAMRRCEHDRPPAKPLDV